MNIQFFLKRGCCVVLLAVLPALAAPGPAWTPLFNGRDLTGWAVQCRTQDRTNTFWKVEQGAIVADSLGHSRHDYVWLVSEKEYSDFVLRLKFQVFKESPGNSGIQIRSRYDQAAGWLDGPQIDINPPGSWRTGMIWDETRGVQRWLHPNLPKGKWVDPSMAKPSLTLRFYETGEEWNDMEITAVGWKISVVLNGLRVTDFDGAGLLDDLPHQQRQVGRTGHLALQIHAHDQLKIRFKDIQIQELPPPRTPN